MNLGSPIEFGVVIFYCCLDMGLTREDGRKWLCLAEEDGWKGLGLGGKDGCRGRVWPAKAKLARED